jgi:hypothetical protein
MTPILAIVWLILTMTMMVCPVYQYDWDCSPKVYMHISTIYRREESKYQVLFSGTIDAANC